MSRSKRHRVSRVIENNFQLQIIPRHDENKKKGGGERVDERTNERMDGKICYRVSSSLVGKCAIGVSCGFMARQPTRPQTGNSTWEITRYHLAQLILIKKRTFLKETQQRFHLPPTGCQRMHAFNYLYSFCFRISKLIQWKFRQNVPSKKGFIQAAYSTFHRINSIKHNAFSYRSKIHGSFISRSFRKSALLPPILPTIRHFLYLAHPERYDIFCSKNYRE